MHFDGTGTWYRRLRCISGFFPRARRLPALGHGPLAVSTVSDFEESEREPSADAAAGCFGAASACWRKGAMLEGRGVLYVPLGALMALVEAAAASSSRLPEASELAALSMGCGARTSCRRRRSPLRAGPALPLAFGGTSAALLVKAVATLVGRAAVGPQISVGQRSGHK